VYSREGDPSVPYNTILKWKNHAGKPKVAKIASKTKPKKSAANTWRPDGRLHERRAKKTAASTLKTDGWDMVG